MSDTDESNTDGGDADDGGFDKETERERLREKYERDKQRRQATQRMSELLLKGATMTNQHCESCGSPLFRHDGEVFCPTCQGTREVIDENADSDAGTDEVGADAGGTTGTDDGTSSDQGFDFGDRREHQGTGTGERRGDDGRGTPEIGAEAGSDDSRPTSGRAHDARRDRSPVPSTGADGSPDREPLLDSGRGPSPRESSVEEAPSLSQAKASLRRAIVSLSEQAAQSDDPGRAHDLLEGTREAAEALAALGGDKE